MEEGRERRRKRDDWVSEEWGEGEGRGREERGEKGGRERERREERSVGRGKVR